MDFNIILNVFTFVVVIVGGVVIAIQRARDAKNSDNREELEAARATATEWRSEAEAIRGRTNRLHDDLDQQISINQKLAEEVGKLKAMPDLGRILIELSEQRKEHASQMESAMGVISRMFDKHEQRAHERHQLILEAFKNLNDGLVAINQSLRDTNGEK